MLHAKLGRNDPCPCGSGKKYKKCCAQEAVTSADDGAAPDLGPLLLLVNSGRHAELEVRVKAMLERYPDSGHLWKIFGLSLWNQAKDALPALETAAQLLPSDAEAQCNVGNLLRSRGRLDEAAARHRQAIAIDARYAEAHNNLGSVLRDLGRLEEAAASYRRALSIKPDYAMAHHNLGLALQALGRVTEAAASFRRALVMKPDYPEAHASMGKALEELGRLEDAVASYRRALEDRPSDAGIHQTLGTALLRLRRSEEAAASYGKALELNPRLTETHNNLGNALRELGRIDAAAESYRRALALEPNSAEIHCNLGNVLADLGRWEQAVESYRRALEIKPGYAKAYNHLGNVLRLLNRTHEAETAYRRGLDIDPDSSETTSSLADLHADRGLFDEAEALYRRAIAIKPDFPRAWAGIAGLRKMTDDDRDWLAEAQRIAGQDLPPREEMHLRYALGKYCDDVEEFDQAFHHYRRANELAKTCRPSHDRRQLTNTFDLMAQFYDQDWLREAKIDVNGSQRPVFIVGMPRSGTSLAEQILASHPAVFGAGELPFWNPASAQVAAAAVRGEPAHAAVAPFADEYLRLLAERSADALRVTDKMPGNFAYMGLIHAAFPNARFIHMGRGPVDTCLSIYFQNFHLVHSYTNDLGDLAHYYTEYLRITRHWRSVLPPDVILEVPYEALIEDPETWSRKMVEFIGLPWDAACLDFHRTSRNVSTFSRWQVRQKINKSSVDRWQNYAQYVGPLLPLTESVSRG
jgi:tetratricopeptide (TPR) repeat protein